MSFDRNSNFNKEANFTGVKFGENKPVLEVELNELQEIQNEARADIIRDSIPSGFVTLSDLDFDYMSNVDNKIKLKSDSVAYVNGYKITIPKDTIIDLGSAPEQTPREDLVFLEVWKEEVTKDSVITKNGGEGQATIPNTIQDSRYPIETTRRIALKWRIRVVPNVDFNTYPEGVGIDESTWNTIGWSSYTPSFYVQGGRETPLEHPLSQNSHYLFLKLGGVIRNAQMAENRNLPIDWGLYVSGLGTDKNKQDLCTLDGRVYAIPMFRLYRKPSCGKAKPFEFRKICSIIDQSKFAKLVGEEKVEAVSDIDIKGASLVNLTNTLARWDTTNSQATIEVFSREVVNETVTLVNLSPRTVYVQTSNVSDGSYGSVLANLPPNSFKIATLPSDRKLRDIIGRAIDGWSDSNKNEFKVLVLQGSINLSKLPSNVFNGISSLGEQEGNLVTVKSGVIEKDNIDPCTDIIKTNAYSGVTNVLSPNNIIPSVEADLVRNGTVVESLTTLPYKTTNSQEGDLVRVNKVKGKTYQNLSPFGNNKVTVSRVAPSGRYPLPIYLKANTKYTFICETEKANPVNSTLTLTIRGYSLESTYHQFGEFVVGAENKTFMTLLTTNVNVRDFILGVGSGSHDDASVTLKNIIVLEGDHTSNPNLPSYFEGIKSVGEEENNKVTVKSVGKNVFNLDSIDQTYLGPNVKKVGNSLVLKEYANGTNLKANMLGMIGGKTYRMSSIVSITSGTNNNGIAGQFRFFDGTKWLAPTNGIYNIPNDIANYTVYIYGANGGSIDGCTISNIQIEEGTEPTPYEPYKESVQTIPLREPLRSLPNGVADSVEKVGDVYKVIRRVGKVVLDGSENWTKPGGSLDTELTTRYCSPRIENLKLKSELYCSHLPTATSIIETTTNIYAHNSDYSFHIRHLKTDSRWRDLNSFKTWLQANPTTVYYELATPITEDIPHNFDRESARTYQLDSPLRSLPNGVKDEIKDGVLIRRCGQVTLNGSEKDWQYTSPSNRFDVGCNIAPLSVTPEHFRCDRLNYNGRPVTDPSQYINYNNSIGYYLNTNRFYIFFNESIKSLESCKAWVRDNNITLVYALATPIEIPLKEVLPTSADYSLQRHLTATNYLRELPNGIKDTLEGGKVKRRVGRIVLNGSEVGWQLHLNNTNTSRFQLTFNQMKPSVETQIQIVCDKLKVVPNTSWQDDVEQIETDSSSRFGLRISKSKLATLDLTGFKAWLQANPITVLYELATPTEEAITDISISTPCHPINTYVGGLYVTDGINHVYTDNNIPKETPLVVNTPFRQIGESTIIEDCKYKKHYDGCEMIDYGLGKNKLPQITGLKGDNTLYPNLTNSGKVTISFVAETQGGRCGVYVYDGDTKIDSKAFSSGNVVLVFDLPYVSPNIRFSFNGWDNGSTITKISSLQLEYGDKQTPYEPYIKGERPLTSIEQNNIDDLRHRVSLTGFNYSQLLADSFDLALRGELQ